jgi:hypothetical protein
MGARGHLPELGLSRQSLGNLAYGGDLHPHAELSRCVPALDA